MQVYELDLDVPVVTGHRNLLNHLQVEIESRLPAGAVPQEYLVSVSVKRFREVSLRVIHFAPSPEACTEPFPGKPGSGPAWGTAALSGRSSGLGSLGVGASAKALSARQEPGVATDRHG